MKDDFYPIAVAIEIIHASHENYDLSVLPLVLSALQRGVEIGWEDPDNAEKIMRLEENDMTRLLRTPMFQRCAIK